VRGTLFIVDVDHQNVIGYFRNENLEKEVVIPMSYFGNRTPASGEAYEDTEYTQRYLALGDRSRKEIKVVEIQGVQPVKVKAPVFVDDETPPEETLRAIVNARLEGTKNPSLVHKTMTFDYGTPEF